MKAGLVQYYNCQILWRHSLIWEDLWIKDGIIQDPMFLFFEQQVKADFKINCHGLIIAPGFIDIHLNGGFEVDFSSNVQDTEEGISKVAKNILQFGVTSFCPTIVTSPDYIYQQILPKIKKNYPKDKAGVLGVHLEGPFISTEKRGAHPIKYIKEMEEGIRTMTKTYGSLENVILMTLAPELKHSSNVIKHLTSDNIKVAIGHSITGLVQAEDAVNNGANLVTHLFNASRLFFKGDPGVFGLLTSKKVPQDRQIYYSVIADGLHTHPATLRLAYKTSPKGVVLVTNALTAMGLESGTYQLGQQQVAIDGIGAYLTESNILAGSIATMSQCVKNYYSATGSSLAEALEAATLHPAQCLGVEDRKGTLEYGTDADFVILDEKLNVFATFVAGQKVYESPNCDSENLQFIYQECD